MRTRLLCLIGAAAFTIWVGPVAAQTIAQPVDPERMTLAKSYLEASKQTVSAKQLGDIVASNLIKINPDLKDQITKAATTVVPGFEAYVQTMIDDVARVYALRFTAPELKEIIAFYQTPTGQKLATETPSAAMESYQVSAKWGAHIAGGMRDAIAKALSEQGITMKLPPPPQQ